jgi:membrane associated rhomboid family serine protease
VAVFLFSNLVGGQFLDLFGLVPRHVIVDRWWWQVVSYLFIHGSIMHLLFNLFALLMFGMPVESQWGGFEFLKYYFICGLGAAAASLAMNPHSLIPVIGASGPVYGLLVAFAMLYPDAVVYLYFLIPVSAKHMAILFGLIEFFAGATGSTPGIARFAHLGGMITGYVYIRWWWIIKIKSKGAFKDMFSNPQLGVKPKSLRGATLPGAQAIADSMEEIDRILDKILATGMESLTEEEREIMKRYSEKKKLH